MYKMIFESVNSYVKKKKIIYIAPLETLDKSLNKLERENFKSKAKLSPKSLSTMQTEW